MIEIEEEGAVHEIRLARPPVNALDPELVSALCRAIEAAPSRGAEAIVLSGSPGIFSAGLDIVELIELDRARMAVFFDSFFGLTRLIARSRVPICAAITGHSPAGGAVLSLYCDYRIMAEGAFKIGLNEVRVGLPLPEGIWRALVYVVGGRQAERLAVGGLMMTPGDALAVGLVDELESAERVVARAHEWCSELLSIPKNARRRTREMSRAELRAATDSFEPGFRDDFIEVWFGDELQETMRALIAKLRS